MKKKKLTIQQKKDKLIHEYTQRQTEKMRGYIKKIKSMTNMRLQQEYDIIILGKEYKPEKKKAFKEEMTYKKSKKVDKNDIKDMW
jgi:hypothetical protein